ncbi:MAG: hypothetical protein HC882_09725 [Acidobacteria bacterium]|nr:hypothetical protein [Acidobacteriota bacterium]
MQLSADPLDLERVPEVVAERAEIILEPVLAGREQVLAGERPVERTWNRRLPSAAIR